MVGLAPMMYGSGAASGGDNRSGGIVAVALDPIDGYLVEGFEIGIRFETSDGSVIAAHSWNEFIRTLDEPSLDDYYDAVLEQSVPAGEVVILATVELGSAIPPPPPDLSGDMPCQMTLDVPENGQVSVFISFSERQCLHD